MQNLNIGSNPMLARWVRVGFFVFTALLLNVTLVHAQDVTSKQKSEFKKIASAIKKAGRQYKDEKFESSAQSIRDAQERMETLIKDPSNELLEYVQPTYQRLATAHQLLTDKGQKLEELKPLPKQMFDGKQAVSFSENVAPIIMAKCGRCHVNRRSGGVSAANYDALLNSGIITFGKADDSRFIEVIVDGDMPRGGLKVEKEELETLKAWINQGAKFDGEDSSQPLSELAKAPERNDAKVKLAKPTGKETVSFGLDVAPILVQNCTGCHIQARNPRGGLDMNNFRQLLAGGDSGPILVPGKSAESNIVKRLQSGEMPPNGKLDDAQIKTIAKWISEGASYDGGDNPRLDIKVVAATSKAQSQSHEELVTARAALVDKNWSLVMPGLDGNKVVTDNFFVMGAMPKGRLTEVGELAETLTDKIVAALKSDKSKPFIKGNSSIFTFAQRYDFSEFGKMVEKREFPKKIRGYWGFSTVDSYVGIVFTRVDDIEELSVPMTQQLAALHVASMSPDIPRWFADGLGHWTAAKIHSRDDSVRAWDDQAQAIMSNMQKPDDFMTGKTAEHDAALVGYVFIKKLRSLPGFKKLMRALGEGKSFEDAFLKSFKQTPSQMVGGGQKPNW